MKTGFFQSIRGNESSSRLIGFIIIVVALLDVNLLIFLGKADVINTAIAAGTLFITIAGPAMAFLFFQKQSEIKRELEEENK